MTGHVRPSSTWTRFTVLLVADPPSENRNSRGEGPAGRHEALVALARAVLAAGGRVVLPADPGVALVLATVGLEYVSARAAERREEVAAPPVMVAETVPQPHIRSRSLLAPFVVRGVVEYREASGEVLPADELGRADPDAIGDISRGRDPITPRFLEMTRPDRAVLLSTSRRTFGDLSVLRETRVPVVALRGTAHDRSVREFLSGIEDPSTRLLADRPRSRWGDNDFDHDPDRPPPPVPYSYVMQRLVAEWSDRG